MPQVLRGLIQTSIPQERFDSYAAYYRRQCSSACITAYLMETTFGHQWQVRFHIAFYCLRFHLFVSVDGQIATVTKLWDRAPRADISLLFWVAESSSSVVPWAKGYVCRFRRVPWYSNAAVRVLPYHSLKHMPSATLDKTLPTEYGSSLFSGIMAWSLSTWLRLGGME